MTLDQKTIALIAVGAAVGANCHPCLERTADRAWEAGLTDQEIADAAEIGRTVRAGAAKSMDQLIAKLTGQPAPADQPGCSTGCKC